MLTKDAGCLVPEPALQSPALILETLHALQDMLIPTCRSTHSRSVHAVNGATAADMIEAGLRRSSLGLGVGIGLIAPKCISLSGPPTPPGGWLRSVYHLLGRPTDPLLLPMGFRSSSLMLVQGALVSGCCWGTPSTAAALSALSVGGSGTTLTLALPLITSATSLTLPLALPLVALGLVTLRRISAAIRVVGQRSARCRAKKGSLTLVVLVAEHGPS